MGKSITPSKLAEIMQGFNHYLEETKNKELMKFEKTHWKKDHEKYMELVDDLEIENYNLFIDLGDLDEDKFHNGKGGLGKIEDREKELKKAHKENIKDFFLTPTSTLGLEYKLDERLYNKYISFTKKKKRFVKRIKMKHEINKHSLFKDFLKTNYPKEVDAQEFKGIFMGRVKQLVYSFSEMGKSRKKGEVKVVDNLMEAIPKGCVKQLSGAINKKNRKVHNKKKSNVPSLKGRDQFPSKGTGRSMTR